MGSWHNAPKEVDPRQEGFQPWQNYGAKEALDSPDSKKPKQVRVWILLRVDWCQRGLEKRLWSHLSTKMSETEFVSEPNQIKFDLNKIILHTCVCGLKFRSTILSPWILVSGWEADLNHDLNYTIRVDSDIPIPVYFTFAYYSFKDLTQLRTLKKNIPQPSQKNPQRKYKNKGSLTRKSSQLPKGAARRRTSPFGMLKFQRIFKNLHATASSPTTLYICRTRMETHPAAPQPTPRPHVLIPNSVRAHCHGLCGTAEAVTSFPPSFLTRKWLTHVFHVSIYQQIIRPVFWDLVTGPINCELPNNVYNQLLMALC